MWNSRGSIKKEVEFPLAFKKKSCGISMGPGFWPQNFQGVVMYPEIFLGRLVHTLHPKQHLKFASAVGKCQDFCQGISPFYSICLGNKNAEAVKFLKIKKKKSFPRTKKGIFFFFIKRFFFSRCKLFMCIYIQYSYLHFIYF